MFDNLTLLAPVVAMVVAGALAWRTTRAPDAGTGGLAASAVTGLINAPVLLLAAATNLTLAFV